jgi:hypothetical protein
VDGYLDCYINCFTWGAPLGWLQIDVLIVKRPAQNFRYKPRIFGLRKHKKADVLPCLNRVFLI